MNWFSGRRREGAWLRKGPGLCLGALILVFGLGGFLAAQVWAADPPKSEKPMPQPYRSVKVIDKPRLWSPASDQVEVIYFFWYGCPTCKMIDGLVDELAARLPKEVKLTKLPMAFQENPEWQTHAKLFWALDNLGLEKDFHTAVFSAVQPGDDIGHGPLGLLSVESQKSFARANKIDPEKLAQILASPFVQNQLLKTFSFSDEVEVTSVPSFVVNGRYVVSIESRRPITDFFGEVERLAKEELSRPRSSAKAP